MFVLQKELMDINFLIKTKQQNLIIGIILSQLRKLKENKKISKRKKIANLHSKLAASLDFNKFSMNKSLYKDKNLKVMHTSKNSKIKAAKLVKKLTSYDISMKKNMKRYTPALNPFENTIEVKQLDYLNLPITARHLYSNSNSKESIGESSANSNFGFKIDTKTITEEGTRETSCNKDSNLFMGSFEAPDSNTRIVVINDQTQDLSLIKDKVIKTLNSYRSYCSTLRRENTRLQLENKQLKDMLLTKIISKTKL